MRFNGSARASRVSQHSIKSQVSGKNVSAWDSVREHEMLETESSWQLVRIQNPVGKYLQNTESSGQDTKSSDQVINPVVGIQNPVVGIQNSVVKDTKSSCKGY